VREENLRTCQGGGRYLQCLTIVKYSGFFIARKKSKVERWWYIVRRNNGTISLLSSYYHTREFHNYLPFGLRFDPRVCELNLYLVSVPWVICSWTQCPSLQSLNHWFVLMNSSLWLELFSDWMESEHIFACNWQMFRAWNPTQRRDYDAFPSIWPLQWPAVAVVH